MNAVLPGPTKSEGVAGFIAGIAKAQNITAAQAEKDFFKTARPTSLLQCFASVDEIAHMVLPTSPARFLPLPTEPR